jgi:hypothetical protein
MIRAALMLLMFACACQAARAGECEDTFEKSGNPFTGADYSARISVPDLDVVDAMGQVRGIMIGEKMDLITEDAGTGAMLFEQRSSGTTRAIPTLVDVSDRQGAAVVRMTVKTEKGMLAKQETIKTYMCSLLARVEGGDAGRAAAAIGAGAVNHDDVTVRDVYIFSREIAREAKGNAVAVTARHRGRNYALKGRVDYIQEDGEDFNVSFDIPEQHELALQVPGDREPRVGVACLFNANQLANVLTFRKGDRATFTGAFLRYDDIKRMVWLKDCRQTR